MVSVGTACFLLASNVVHFSVKTYPYFANFSYKTPIFNILEDDGDSVIPASDVSDVDSSTARSDATSGEETWGKMRAMAAELDDTLVAEPSLESEMLPVIAKDATEPETSDVVRCPVSFRQRSHSMKTRSRREKEIDTITMFSDTARPLYLHRQEDVLREYKKASPGRLKQW